MSIACYYDPSPSLFQCREHRRRVVKPATDHSDLSLYRLSHHEFLVEPPIVDGVPSVVLSGKQGGELDCFDKLTNSERSGAASCPGRTTCAGQRIEQADACFRRGRFFYMKS